MIAELLLIVSVAFAATMLGGVFALRFRDRLHLILGFSAGAVVAVALFDLLPEALSSGASYGPGTISLFLAAGFLAYLILDRLILIHPHDHGDGHNHGEISARGIAGALTLSTHSVFDGIAIGIGFQASPSVGLVIAAAVIAHDFSDGINTVSFIVPVLAVFAGSFLYLGASDLIPESHHQHPRAATTLMTLLGAAVIFVAVRASGL